MKLNTVRVGHRVVLPANKGEGWKEERGEVVGISSRTRTVVVRVDAKYVEKGSAAHDDGLREVAVRDVRLEKRRSK